MFSGVHSFLEALVFIVVILLYIKMLLPTKLHRPWSHFMVSAGKNFVLISTSQIHVVLFCKLLFPECLCN
jgi:hypothetical protein